MAQAKSIAGSSLAIYCGPPDMGLDDNIQVSRPSSGASEEFATGWRVLLAATLGCGLGSSALPFYSFGTFVIPLTKEFGWSRGQVSTSLIFMTVALAAIAPLLGSAIDRFGVRRVVFFAAPMLAAMFFALSFSTGSLVLFYATFAAISILAGGTTPVNYTRAVNQQFKFARGLALGIALCGIGIAAILLPLLSASLVADYGWRLTYRALGLIALIAVPVAAFGIPDTRVPSQSKRASAEVGPRFLSTRAFWTLALACFFLSMAIAGMLVHLVPFLRDAGLGAAEAAQYASLIGIGGIGGRLITGWLVDRLFAPYVAAAAFAATTLGCLSLAVYGIDAAPVAAVMIGFSFGAEVDFMSYLVARYFGLRRYGLIYGVIYSFFAIGAAFGPALGGFIYDSTKSYTGALWGAVAILAAGTFAMLTMPSFPTEARSPE